MTLQPDVMTLNSIIERAAVESLGRQQYRVLFIAAGEIGTAENPPGSNAGPVLRYGGKPGQPWCAWFVCHCFHAAIGRWPAKMNHQTGGTGTLLAAAKRATCVFPKPEPGDIAYKPRFDGKGKKIGGHVGLVAAVSPDGKHVLSIEGNRGDAVRVQVRFTSEWRWFIRGPYSTFQQPRLWLGWPDAPPEGAVEVEA